MEATHIEKPRYLVATSHFVAEVDGQHQFIRTGDRVPSDHPIVKGREHLFRERTEAD